MQRSPELSFGRCSSPSTQAALSGPDCRCGRRRLFGLLRYTKENCAHYPQPGPIPANGIWTAADLNEWRNPDNGAYFIAIGHLAPGDYRLQLSFAHHAEGRLKITDQHFEPLVEATLSPAAEQEMTFTVMAGAHYLTLLSQAKLNGMILRPAEKQAVGRR